MTAWLVVFALTGAAQAGPPLVLRAEVTGIESAVAVTHAGDGSRRLFIAQRDGRVLVVQPGARRGETFADLSERISCCPQERGLLGLAFHPRYADNGLFFVNYTDLEGDSVIMRLSVSADPNKADIQSAVEILKIGQPGGSHNSSQLVFGPDGYLYVGVGDGEATGDRADNGQNPAVLLGKILRLDVDSASPYAIPPDNPFVDVPDAQPEIWALGLRNPWRFSFDRETGDLYIGDVGQDSFEEINFQPADSPGGENYGWRLKEGDACYEPPEGCEDEEGLTDPIFSYPHIDDPTTCGGSVIGGVRYRGPRVPTLSGLYVFADLCSREIWGGRRSAAGNWRFERIHKDDELRVISFGEDERGHVYVATSGSRVFRLAGRPLFASDFEDPRLADWSRRKGGPQVAQPGLSDSPTALWLDLDGTSRRVFVRSREPEEARYLRAAFDLAVDRAAIGRRRVELLRFAGDRTILALYVERTEDDRYAVRLVVIEDDGARRLVGAVGIPGAETVRLEVEWMAATADGAADGEATLRKNGRVQGRVSDLDNDELAVNSVLLGLPGGSRRASGSMRIDNYTSSR